MKVSHGTIVSTVIFLLTLLVIVILVRTYATGPRSLIAPKCSPLDVDFIKVRIQRCRFGIDLDLNLATVNFPTY